MSNMLEFKTSTFQDQYSFQSPYPMYDRTYTMTQSYYHLFTYKIKSIQHNFLLIRVIPMFRMTAKSETANSWSKLVMAWVVIKISVNPVISLLRFYVKREVYEWQFSLFIMIFSEKLANFSTIARGFTEITWIWGEWKFITKIWREIRLL